MSSTPTPPGPFADPAGTWKPRFEADGFLFGREGSGHRGRSALVGLVARKPG